MSDCINYLVGGKLGDFFHMLMVIKQNYKKFGKKGNLYLSVEHGGDNFSYPLGKVLNDTKELIYFQDYINSYQIHNQEDININLNKWRSSKLLYGNGWIDILCDTFKINPITSNWLDYLKTSDYENYTVIHRTFHRHNEKFPWSEIIEKEKCLFVSTNPEEERLFKTIYSVDSLVVNEISELALIINSSKKFVGNMSAPLSLAHALGKHRLAELINSDQIHYINDKKYLPNFWYIKDYDDEIPKEFL